MDIEDLGETAERISALIMKAREPWFAEEEQTETESKEAESN
jgi:predicted ATP-grasp superfamily ATP-dependent carboligase